MSTQNKDPYSPDLWSPVVDVIITPPEEPPRNFDTPYRGAYSDAPPKEKTMMLRMPLRSFKTQAGADAWANKEYNVIEVLHSARMFCWRVKRDS